ncbi:hypothetical protein BJ741DRAFT_148273 [Chytriomyces cf. hyalinus JEL632]|nr:hypothetical protein BJ741DRAFT_148273 [Chytriomyces cf. hyalinus JEL632]
MRARIREHFSHPSQTKSTFTHCTLLKSRYMSNPSTSIHSLPREIVEQVLLHLPIDTHIRHAAMSSRIMSQILLHDPHFARTHINRRCCIQSEWDLHLELESILNTLPLSYLTIVFQSLLVDTNGLQMYHWNFRNSPWQVLSQQRGEKMVARLSAVVQKENLPRLLDWLREWKHSSNQAAATILKDHVELFADHEFMTHAVTKGWTDVAQLLVDRGFDVSNYGNDVLEQAVDLDHWEVASILLQDKRVDPTIRNCILLSHIQSLQMAKAVLQDPRVTNGSFILSALLGHVEQVKSALQEPNWDPREPAYYCVKFSVKFNSPQCLEVLLSDERMVLDADIQRMSIKFAVDHGFWTVYHVLLRYAQFDLHDKDWGLLLLLCKKDNLDAFKAFESHERVKPWIGDRQRQLALHRCCAYGSIKILEYLLAQPDTDLDINSSELINTVIKYASLKAGRNQCEIMDLLASKEGFEMLHLEDTEPFLANSRMHASSALSKYILTEQQFFSSEYLQRAFDEACTTQSKSAVGMLIVLPGIQIDKLQYRNIRAMFQLFEQSTPEQVLCAIYFQFLRQAVGANDLVRQAALLRNGSRVLTIRELHAVFLDAGRRESCESWILLVKHLVEWQLAGGVLEDDVEDLGLFLQCCVVLGRLVASLDGSLVIDPTRSDGLSMDERGMVLEWVGRHELDSVAKFVQARTCDESG